MSTPSGHYVHISEGLVELTLLAQTVAGLTRILEAHLSAGPLSDEDLALCATLAALFRSATLASVQQTVAVAGETKEAQAALAALGL